MMKRIAALTALVITLLAVPAAAAMATTGGQGSGYAKPTPVQLVCARIHHFPRVYVIRHHKRIPVRIRIRGTRPAKPILQRADQEAGERQSAERDHQCSR